MRATPRELERWLLGPFRSRVVRVPLRTADVIRASTAAGREIGGGGIKRSAAPFVRISPTCNSANRAHTVNTFSRESGGVAAAGVGVFSIFADPPSPRQRRVSRRNPLIRRHKATGLEQSNNAAAEADMRGSNPSPKEIGSRHFSIRSR